MSIVLLDVYAVQVSKEGYIQIQRKKEGRKRKRGITLINNI